MKHIYIVHPVECQPQWYNKDCDLAPLHIRYATHIAIVVVVVSALAFGLFVLALVGAI